MAECIANTKQEMLNGFKLACTITASDKVAFSWTCHLLNVICCKFHRIWAELGPGVSSLQTSNDSAIVLQFIQQHFCIDYWITEVVLLSLCHI